MSGFANVSKTCCIIILISVSLSAECYAEMPSFMERAYSAQCMARKAGFHKEYVSAGIFTLMTYQRFGASSERIRIYIEGDGNAWKTRSRLSSDPTPSDPVALRLAAADPLVGVSYIARPGQFPSRDSPVCDPTYWSARRFAPEVVEAIDKAVDILKERSGAKKVELVGYSGGGALAVLVAARRKDIHAIRTVAGNLDPKAFCDYHNVSRLEGSMDPLDAAQKTAGIPQRHFAGSKDKIVPPSIAESFVKMEGCGPGECITIVKGATHKYGWWERWKEFLSMPLIVCRKDL